jgi:hypothetical protein
MKTVYPKLLKKPKKQRPLECMQRGGDGESYSVLFLL